MDVYCTRTGNLRQLPMLHDCCLMIQVACVIGSATYFWIVDFPERAHLSFCFLSAEQSKIASSRIQKDRGDVIPAPFTWSEVLKHFLDLKVYGFALQFFLLVGHDLDFCHESPNRLRAELGFHISFVLSTNNVSLSQSLTSRGCLCSLKSSERNGLH